MLNILRTSLFVFGFILIAVALYIIHGDGEYSKEFIFCSISIIVMYIMVFAPFTFFTILPKNENIDKAIAAYTTSWLAITAYCSASIVLLICTITRNIFLSWIMDLPKDWINQLLGENNDLIQKAAHYSDLIFYAIVVIQLILFFIFLIKVFLGGIVVHQIGAVKKQETEEFSKIAQLRSESQLLEIESSRNESITPEQKRAIAKIKTDLRYLSPANSKEAFNYEDQMLDAISALRSRCKQNNTSPEEIQNMLDSFENLYQTRKLILKN